MNLNSTISHSYFKQILFYYPYFQLSYPALFFPVVQISPLNTLGPTYNEFGYNEQISLGYNEHLLVTSSFFCNFSLLVSGTQCNEFAGTCSYGYIGFCLKRVRLKRASSCIQEADFFTSKAFEAMLKDSLTPSTR